jgi:glycosyltransferase involved in cell wall biosynthesis
MRIGIATPTLVDGDAVGNDVVGMYLSLKREGHNVFLFAENNHMPLIVNSFSQVGSVNLDVYIYHHSIGCDLGVKWLSDLKCRRIVKYHNITPPHFFPSNTGIVNNVNKGLGQLNTILNLPCEIWADSEFNGQDLCKVKPCNYKVIPPFHHVDLLLTGTTDNKFVNNYNDWNTNILMVGRLAPNKDILEGVEGFAKYNQRNKHSRLLIVGDGFGDYANKVREKINQLGLNDKITITGKVDTGALKALYLVSDLLLITSKHEGFCVPMIEAMAFNLPVIANRHCALPYTGGDAVHYTNNPDEIADGIAYVLDNKTHYIDRGRKMFREKYQNSNIDSLFLTSIQAR